MAEEYLEHHGVLGMKWGVRRYQNYDGSYTQAGLKRFRASKENYERADERYRTAKKAYKAAKKNKSVTNEGTELVNAKLARKQADRKMVKDYKHLKQDKLGDQGKALYASGKTITGNDRVTGILGGVGSLALTAAIYNVNGDTKYKYFDKKTTQLLAAVGGTLYASAGAKALADHHQNKRLRAYYSHTSNY